MHSLERIDLSDAPKPRPRVVHREFISRAKDEMRKQSVNAMRKCGVPIKVAKRLMRNSRVKTR